MPVFVLNDKLIFPSPEQAEKDGLLAIGGDLSPERLLLAYSKGIFPWYSEGQPILWWSPDPRMVLFPDAFKKHKNLRRTITSNKFEVRLDHRFEEVIDRCSQVERKDQLDTWITNDMKDAYIGLHRSGFCHSVETYVGGDLVGGLYGLSLGGAFFGESMFHLVTDASKVALWHLVELANRWNFDMIDVQQNTSHLRSLGAQTIDRKKFLLLLNESLKKETKIGNWEELISK